jgi:hypothetical protein
MRLQLAFLLGGEDTGVAFAAGSLVAAFVSVLAAGLDSVLGLLSPALSDLLDGSELLAELPLAPVSLGLLVVAALLP